MTRKEILLDTFQYYEEDPSRRAVVGEEGGCYYKTEDNRHCAVISK
jgi:hypothetical protein